MWSGAQHDGLERLRRELRGLGDQVLADVRERLGHRPDGQHLVEARALLEQPERALDEHGTGSMISVVISASLIT